MFFICSRIDWPTADSRKLLTSIPISSFAPGWLSSQEFVCAVTLTAATANNSIIFGFAAIDAPRTLHAKAISGETGIQRNP